MGELRSKLLFDGQEECTDSGLESLEEKAKTLFLKDFKKLGGNEEDSTLPWCTGEYSSSNTLLIDHQPYKALLNPPNTVIFPRQSKIDNIKDKFLGSRDHLQFFLDGLSVVEDVPTYVKGRSLWTACNFSLTS